MNIRSTTVRAARRAFGRRDVNITADWMRFGNHLYLWVWAYTRRNDRVVPKVLMTEAMRYWAGLVPEFATRFIIEPEEIRRLDRRGPYHAHPDRHSPDPRGFTDSERELFINEALRPAPLLHGVGTGPLTDDDCLVVNVRRGDYYIHREHISKYGFDVESYVRVAVERSREVNGEVRRIHVVSDDLHWCRRHLDWLRDYGTDVSYPDASETPDAHFRQVASARRIVLANSTFSMWAAAISNTIHRDNSGSIWAPAYFQSVYPPGRCFEYDQRWNFVDEEDLPDGWQPAWLLDGRVGPVS